MKVHTHLVCPKCGWSVTMHIPVRGIPMCSHIGTAKDAQRPTRMIETKVAARTLAEGRRMLKAVAS